MKEIFQEIVTLPGVRGVMLISFNGEILYESFQPNVEKPAQNRDWHLFLEILAKVSETDLVFADGRIYARRTPQGYILIVSSQFVQGAMIRLHCDIMLPELAKTEMKKKKRFFKR